MTLGLTKQSIYVHKQFLINCYLHRLFLDQDSFYFRHIEKKTRKKDLNTFEILRKMEHQTARMRRLVCAFAGRTYHFVGNLMSRLILLNNKMKNPRSIISNIYVLFRKIMEKFISIENHIKNNPKSFFGTKRRQ